VRDESSSFLKKRTKKLFLIWAGAVFKSPSLRAKRRANSAPSARRNPEPNRQTTRTAGTNPPHVPPAQSKLNKVFLLLFVHKKKPFAFL
jgi:hypothetical protein